MHPPRRRSRLFGVGLLVVGAALAVLALALAFVDRSHPDAAASPSLTPWSTAGADPVRYAARLVALTNAERAREGVAALPISACATVQADVRADALAGGKPLEHAPMEPVMTACGVAEAGENLARAAATPDDVVKAWLQSPGHRSNLLDPTYHEIGVGCRLDGDQMLCSQVFLGP
ncbi:CAP domain-containing protein [Cellulomonas alba]|uniref:CAP domain-containing protein n=1 Tax=Cellulomonas alba TaxID=3053467 RepID=A0ABT7SIR9_9CELL|nr:CAP domain-containing protein [Cellulomonas alba]MDM7855464.1 CAP domain-containing protein [Cellulomonas alba]